MAGEGWLGGRKGWWQERGGLVGERVKIAVIFSGRSKDLKRVISKGVEANAVGICLNRSRSRGQGLLAIDYLLFDNSWRSIIGWNYECNEAEKSGRWECGMRREDGRTILTQLKKYTHSINSPVYFFKCNLHVIMLLFAQRDWCIYGSSLLFTNLSLASEIK